MRRRRVVLAARTASAVLAALSALSLAAAGIRAQDVPPELRDEFLHQFDNSMARVIALAEALPAEKYAWSPSAGVMPLAEVYAHIARFNYHYPATAMGIAAPAGIDPDTLERISEKAQVLAILRRSAEHVRHIVREMPDAQLGRPTTLYGREVPQWAVLLQLLAHMNDHLGQSIAYARVNGVVPPWSQ
jgi:uncharacterized damage-inducible protein DinB